MRPAIAALVLGLLPTLLQGCGQTGPLYLPADEPTAETNGAASGNPATAPADTETAADNAGGISITPATDTE